MHKTFLLSFLSVLDSFFFFKYSSCSPGESSYFSPYNGPEHCNILEITEGDVKNWRQNKKAIFQQERYVFLRESKTRAPLKFKKYQNHVQCEPWCWVCAGKVAGWRGQCRHLLGAFPPCRHTSAPEQSYRGFHILKTWTETRVNLSVAPLQWSWFNTALANSCPHLFICEWRFWIKLAPGWTSGPLRTSFLIKSRLALFTCNNDKNTLTTKHLKVKYLSHGVRLTLSGYVRILATWTGTATSSILRFGSGEMTVLPEKSTLFPERFPLNRPACIHIITQCVTC